MSIFSNRRGCREKSGNMSAVALVLPESNKRVGAFAGMHTLVAPSYVAKLICRTQGSMMDVIIDLIPHPIT